MSIKVKNYTDIGSFLYGVLFTMSIYAMVTMILDKAHWFAIFIVTLFSLYLAFAGLTRGMKIKEYEI